MTHYFKNVTSCLAGGNPMSNTGWGDEMKVEGAANRQQVGFEQQLDLATAKSSELSGRSAPARQFGRWARGDLR